MDVIPNWNKPGAYSMGRDPLGMQAASVRLYTDLVPGLTNVTNRIRYYSFYCWVVAEFEKREHSSNEEKWRLFIRRAEAAYVLSCVAFDGSGAAGMAGSDWAHEHFLRLSSDPFNFTKWTDSPGTNGQYLKAVRGNFGQFYISSMIEEGLLLKTKSKIPLVSEELGRKFATAFEAACPGASNCLRNVIESGEITKEQAKDIAQEASPAKLPDSLERTLLIKFLIGQNTEKESGAKRFQSLWNALTALDRIGSWDTNEIRNLFYIQENDDGTFPKKFGYNLNEWRAYQANEFCHIALELLLNDISHEIDSVVSGQTPQIAVSNVIARAYAEKAIQNHSLHDYAEQKSKVRTLSSDCLAAEDIREALSDPETRPVASIVKAALELLCVLYARWKNVDYVQTALDPVPNFGRSLAALNEYLRKHENEPLSDALAKVIEKFVISNHLHIAGQKLANSGTFTFRFLSEDGILKDVRRTKYDYTTPRLFNLLRFAEDLGFIKNDKLTDAGREVLDVS